jgi:hypothetical protein
MLKSLKVISLTGGFIALWSLAGPTGALAWSEQNCRQACDATAIDPALCKGPQVHNCVRFRGGRDESARARRMIIQWNKEHGTPAQRRRAGKVWSPYD